MKCLSNYLLEALDTKVTAWLKQVYDTMQQLIKNNKLQPIDINVEQLAKPEKPFLFDDFANANIVKKLISDKNIGFTVTNQMLRMPKKYLVDTINNEQKEIKPNFFPYWYRPSSATNEAKADEETTKETTDKIDPTYFVGIIMYDTTTTYVEGYINLIGIESSLCIKDSQTLLKAMLNDWGLHQINKEGKYEGICAKPTHPKMKAILQKLGFSISKDNKDILTYKL